VDKAITFPKWVLKRLGVAVVAKNVDHPLCNLEEVFIYLLCLQERCFLNLYFL